MRNRAGTEQRAVPFKGQSGWHTERLPFSDPVPTYDNVTVSQTVTREFDSPFANRQGSWRACVTNVTIDPGNVKPWIGEWYFFSLEMVLQLHADSDKKFPKELRFDPRLLCEGVESFRGLAFKINSWDESIQSTVASVRRVHITYTWIAELSASALSIWTYLFPPTLEFFCDYMHIYQSLTGSPVTAIPPVIPSDSDYNTEMELKRIARHALPSQLSTIKRQPSAPSLVQIYPSLSDVSRIRGEQIY
jgi:hypothetical protein